MACLVCTVGRLYASIIDGNVHCSNIRCKERGHMRKSKNRQERPNLPIDTPVIP